MNLRFAKIFGKLWTTPKMDRYLKEIKEENNIAHNFDKSPHYPKYAELVAIITNPEFIKKKKYLQNRKYKDTDEYKKLNEYKKLKSSLTYKFYSYLSQKEPVQQYLKQITNTQNPTPASSQPFSLRKFLSLQQSKEIRRFFELKEIIENDEFKKLNAFWSNPNRWNLTNEAKQEKEFNTLCKIEEVKAFRNINKKRVQHFDKISPKAEETYLENKLENTIWQGGFFQNNNAMKAYYSSVDQMQAFNEGKNIFIRNGILSLHFRKEEKDQLAWSPKGFVMHHFPYTSDIINTGKSTLLNKGIIILKVRAYGASHQSITLQQSNLRIQNTDNNTNVILFHRNKNNIEIGIQKGNKRDVEPIKGINANEWYYFFFLWNERELIWLVNNIEVCRRPNSLGDNPYYLQAVCYLPKKANENKLNETGELQLAFTGVYSTKEDIQNYIFNIQ